MSSNLTLLEVHCYTSFTLNIIALPPQLLQCLSLWASHTILHKYTQNLEYEAKLWPYSYTVYASLTFNTSSIMQCSDHQNTV